MSNKKRLTELTAQDLLEMQFSIKQKTCPTCNTTFSCTNTEPNGTCWCESLPPVFSPNSATDCLCPTCLKEAITKKLSEQSNVPGRNV